MIYYFGANFYLIDPTVLDLPKGTAIPISLGLLGLGRVAYDLICKSRLGENSTRLMIGRFVILVAMAWGYSMVFSGRAALPHLGAFTARIMSGNVFMAIVPNQRGWWRI